MIAASVTPKPAPPSSTGLGEGFVEFVREARPLVARAPIIVAEGLGEPGHRRLDGLLLGGQRDIHNFRNLKGLRRNRVLRGRSHRLISQKEGKSSASAAISAPRQGALTICQPGKGALSGSSNRKNEFCDR